MSYESSTLQVIPDIVTLADRERLSYAITLDLPSKIQLYEELVQVYDSHPFLLVRLGETLAALRSGSVAIDAFRQAKTRLLIMGITDNFLDKVIERYEREVDDKVQEDLAASEKRIYYQVWKPTREHIFPTNLPHLPPGHQEVKDQWTALTTSGSVFFRDYLRKLVIETNHLESTFLITEGSTRDIVRRGIAEAVVYSCPESARHDSSKIKSILNDTLEAYEMLLPLVNDPGTLDRDTLCRVHARLIKSCRFIDGSYISAGVTRSVTRKTVVVSGTYSIQCCPFNQVDAELDTICNLAKQWSKSWRNPFATASWIHLVLVRCHPFEDGNGRLTRLVASIPLMKYGYPPISIAFTQRADYYDAINKAYTGDHSLLAQCILQGMQETIASVQSLQASE